MKKNTVALVFGILFGIALGAAAYFYLVLGIVMSIAGNGVVAYFMYLFVGLALVTIVLSAFARKNIMVTRVGLTTTLSIALLCDVYTVWQLFALASEGTADLAGSIMFIICVCAPLVFGIIATVFAYLGKKKEKPANLETVSETK